MLRKNNYIAFFLSFFIIIIISFQVVSKTATTSEQALKHIEEAEGVENRLLPQEKVWLTRFASGNIPANMSGWKKYESQKFGISFKYPGDWKLEEAALSDPNLIRLTYIGARFEHPEALMPELFVVVSPKQEGKICDSEWWNKYRNLLDLHKSPLLRFQLGTGFRLDINLCVDGTVVSIYDPNVMAWSEQSEEELDVYESIVKSVRFVDSDFEFSNLYE